MISMSLGETMRSAIRTRARRNPRSAFSARMQTRARHDAGAFAEYGRSAFFNVDQLVKTDPSLLVIEEEIGVWIFPCLIPGGRAE